MFEGRKVLLGLQLGSRESYEDWLDFGRDLLARGMRPPALLIADGAPGLWKAARELWPAALEQRCTVHALRNVTKKLPERWFLAAGPPSPPQGRYRRLRVVAELLHLPHLRACPLPTKNVWHVAHSSHHLPRLSGATACLGQCGHSFRSLTQWAQKGGDSVRGRPSLVGGMKSPQRMQSVQALRSGACASGVQNQVRARRRNAQGIRLAGSP